MKFWLTFGQSHTHSHNGITLDKNCICEFNAADGPSANLIVKKYFGNKYSMLHDTHPQSSVQFYPRGIIQIELL